MVSNMVKLVLGVGINDADYNVVRIIEGKTVFCPFYRKWKSMLERCYSKQFHARRPTYAGCTVCGEWLTLSNFKAWMQKQDWQEKQLDKDLIFPGNKVYSPEACALIDAKTNSFVTDGAAVRGCLPIGVRVDKRGGRYQARCNNPFSKKMENLGYFTCPNEAHQAWRKRKHELACQLADLQTDERVAAALRVRYT